MPLLLLPETELRWNPSSRWLGKELNQTTKCNSLNFKITRSLPAKGKGPNCAVSKYLAFNILSEYLHFIQRNAESKDCQYCYTSSFCHSVCLKTLWTDSFYCMYEQGFKSHSFSQSFYISTVKWRRNSANDEWFCSLPWFSQTHTLILTNSLIFLLSRVKINFPHLIFSFYTFKDQVNQVIYLIHNFSETYFQLIKWA